MIKKCFVSNTIVACLACAAILAGGTAIISGCAGFTEDGNSTPYPQVGVSLDSVGGFGFARFVQSGTVKVDATHDSVTIMYETLGGCVKRNGLIAYDSSYYFVDEYHYAYSFHNDTLLLSSYYEDDVMAENITEMYVGGTHGNLDGVWNLSQCLYVNDVYGCNNDVYDKYVKIEGDKLEYRVGDLPNYDYMSSDFVGELFDFLKSRNSIQLEMIFYSRLGYSPDKYGVSVEMKSNKSMKFIHEGRTFDLNLMYARYSDSVSVVLSSDGMTCIGNYSMKLNVPPELCNEENAPYLHSSNSISGSETLVYEKQNTQEFEDCIDGILGRK